MKGRQLGALLTVIRHKRKTAGCFVLDKDLETLDLGKIYRTLRAWGL